MHRPHGPRARRAGFTLVELLLSMTIFALVVGATLTLVNRQGRFYRGANDIIDTRSQIRQAVSMLPGDLRSVSSVDGDIQAMSSTAFQANATFGSGVICALPASKTPTYVSLPPLTATQNTFVNWQFTPAAGDTMFVFDDGVLTGAEDDAWLHVAVDSVATNTSDCPSGTNTLTQAADNALAKYRVYFHPAIDSTVVTGAPVRFARPVEYSLFAASDGNTYLGFQEYRRAAWSGRQVVAGPFLATGGVVFTYYDSLGTAVTTLANAPKVARVDVKVSGAGVAPTNLLNNAGVFKDSLLTRIALRNRK